MSPLAAAALRCLSLIVLASAMPSAMADWRADPSDRQQVAAEQAIAVIREKRPDSGRFFDEAYGFSIFPKIIRIGLGFGGAYGRGLVVEGDEVIGSTSFRQFTSGIQAGARSFSMILFFKDRQALEYYKASERQFLGQAGLALATYGVAGTPAFNDGVAIFTVTRLGLMAEFTVSGARFTFEPNAATEAAE